MKQTTKAQFRKGVEKRLGAPGEVYTLDRDKSAAAIQSVTDTILSAISNGYDKIRVDGILHITVKKHKGGRAKMFGKGEPMQRPDYYVLNVLVTPAIARALNNRDVGQAKTVSEGQPSATVTNINDAKSA